MGYMARPGPRQSKSTESEDQRLARELNILVQKILQSLGNLAESNDLSSAQKLIPRVGVDAMHTRLLLRAFLTSFSLALTRVDLKTFRQNLHPQKLCQIQVPGTSPSHSHPSTDHHFPISQQRLPRTSPRTTLHQHPIPQCRSPGLPTIP